MEVLALSSKVGPPHQVSDIAIAVREGADAVMLSGETAYGKFPFKAVEVMSTVAHRTESSMLRFSVRAPWPVTFSTLVLTHPRACCSSVGLGW